jgi:hypothetical protein
MVSDARAARDLESSGVPSNLCGGEAPIFSQILVMRETTRSSGACVVP